MTITKLLGAIPSEYDPRDYTVRATVTVYPSTYALSDVPIYDQGKIGNCVMQALRSCPHAHYGKEMGATFGYGRWRDAYTTSSGMRPADACNGFVKEGIPLLTDDKEWLEMPDAQSYAQTNAVRLLKAASPRIGWTWARCSTVNDIKAAIMDGGRCIVCLPYVGFDGDYWDVHGDIQGYHEMCIIGWDDSKGFKVRNSWGTGGGLGGVPKGGYVWLRYADVYACNDVIALFAPKQEEKQDTQEEQTVVRRTLRLNTPYMRGDDVREAQTKLNAHGFPCDTDGVFGKITDRAVKAFQTAKGLTADGIIGKNTWTALDKSPVVSTYDIDAVEALMEMMVGDYYVIGAQGHELTLDYLSKRKADKPNYFTGGRYEYLVGEVERANALGRKLYAEDCSGLLMKCNEVLRFFSAADLTADGIYRQCRPIAKDDVQPGDILFRGSDAAKTHMAWVGRNATYEAAGTAYGVVRRSARFDRATINHVTGKTDTLSDWTHYGRPMV